MKENPVLPLTVFYDGACSVCAREMAHYRRLDQAGQLVFVDISAPGFAPEEFGKSLDEFMARMHVMDAGGRFFFGVDAFPVIWQALPGRHYRLFSAVIALPGVNGMARLGYRLFARYRKYLPKTKGACSDDSCHLRHSR